VVNQIKGKTNFFFSTAQQPLVDQDLLIISRLYDHIQTHHTQ